MNLLTQPGDGSNALLAGINSATKSIEMVIFRFDRREIEAALRAAAARGVFIHALVTYTNRGGEKSLRQLERGRCDVGSNCRGSASLSGQADDHHRAERDAHAEGCQEGRQISDEGLATAVHNYQLSKTLSKDSPQKRAVPR